MIGFRQKGDFSKTENFLKRARQSISIKRLEHYGREGVAALSAATPRDTGLTANSWYYKIVKTKTSATLMFCNSNRQNGVPIAIILEYGHGTRNGGWVEGRHYIDPAIQPIFDKMAKSMWEEVVKL